MKKTISLLSLILAPFVFSQEPKQSLETIIVQHQKAVKETLDVLPHYYIESCNEILALLKSAKDKRYDLSKEYPNTSSQEASIQYDLILKTRRIHAYVPFYLHTHHWIGIELAEDALSILEEAKKALGKHPFRHVIIGRQKEIVQTAQKENIPVPNDYQKYSNVKIAPWETPSLNYTRLSDLPPQSEYIPPEYRKDEAKK